MLSYSNPWKPRSSRRWRSRMQQLAVGYTCLANSFDSHRGKWATKRGVCYVCMCVVVAKAVGILLRTSIFARIFLVIIFALTFLACRVKRALCISAFCLAAFGANVFIIAYFNFYSHQFAETLH